MEVRDYFFNTNNIFNPSNHVNIDSNKTKESLTFQGCNAEKIEDQGKTFFLPRTLYNLFFIYFSMKRVEGNNYAILDSYAIDADNYADGCTNEECQKEEEDLLNSGHKELGEDILNFFNEKKIDLENCTWKETSEIILEIWDELGKINTSSAKRGARSLRDYFFRYIYPKGKNLIIDSISKEWSLPFDTVIVYRCAKLKNENLKHKNDELHSFSFGTSLISGIVYEGGVNGTCPLSYGLNWGVNDLYGLHLSAKKLQRYFFYPQLCNGIFPLVSNGEFSHPRLKVFLESDKSIIEGVNDKQEIAKKRAVLRPGDILKIKNFNDYLEKVKKIYTDKLIIFSNRDLVHQEEQKQEGADFIEQQ